MYTPYPHDYWQLEDIDVDVDEVVVEYFNIFCTISMYIYIDNLPPLLPLLLLLL